jgi:hypothetical protein
LPLSSDNFLVPSDVADSRFAVAVRRMTEAVAAYVFLRHDRRADGAITAELWLAPLDSPDDAFDKLGVGYKTVLGRTFDEPTEGWFAAVRSRIITYVNAAADLAQAVEKELESPPWITDRLTMYRIQVQAFKDGRELDAELSYFLMDREKKLAAEVQTAARTLATKLIRAHPEYGEHESVLEYMLLRQSYIEGLLRA